MDVFELTGRTEEAPAYKKLGKRLTAPVSSAIIVM